MADNLPAAGSAGSAKRRKTPRFTSNEHNLKKRQPQKPIVSDSVLYVSTKSSVKGLLKKCDDLIFKGENEIVILCLGAAIQRGILLALQLAENYVAFTISTNTFTTELIDDLEPATDEADYEIQKRQNSALRIILTRMEPLQKA